MPVQIAGDYVTAGTSLIPLATFPNLVEQHLHRCPTTRCLEQEAAVLKGADFPEGELERFIRSVCKWGNYAGIAGRIINQNPIETIRQHFRAAVHILEVSPLDAQGALQEINQIRQLGRPSFASKHLRFLRPDVCPVLDRILSGELNYQLNPKGYKLLAEDCIRIAEILESNQVANPMNRDNGRWFAADVEMALFARVSNL